MFWIGLFLILNVCLCVQCNQTFADKLCKCAYPICGVRPRLRTRSLLKTCAHNVDVQWHQCELCGKRFTRKFVAKKAPKHLQRRTSQSPSQSPYVRAKPTWLCVVDYVNECENSIFELLSTIHAGRNMFVNVDTNFKCFLSWVWILTIVTFLL